MKKRYKALIFFASLGIVVSLVGAIGMKFDFSSLTRKSEFKEITYRMDDLSTETLNFNIQSCKVEIIESDSTSLDITIFTDKEEYFTNEGSKINFLPQTNLEYWYNPFVYFTNNYQMKIAIPSTFNISNLKINTKASTINMDFNANVSNVDFNLSASSVYLNNVTLNNLKLASSASTTNIKTSTINNIEFDLKASSLDAEVCGEIIDYGVDITSEASSVEGVINTVEGNYSKFIKGVVKASTVKFKFI